VVATESACKDKGEGFTAMEAKTNGPEGKSHYLPSENREPIATAKQYTIILADDHVMLRCGIKKIIEEAPNLKVVGEAGDGYEVLDLLTKYIPDLVILDISMPRCGGMEASKEIRKIYPGLKVLILTMHRDKEYMLRAMGLGVDGYLLKDSAPDELIEAIFTLKEGKTYFSPILSKYEPFEPKVLPTPACEIA
jgi:DNA-binding NarL/FixJ family response regulator